MGFNIFRAMEKWLSSGYWVGGILLMITLGIYFQTTGFGWVLDDGIVVEKNRFVKEGFGGIKDILSHDTFAGYEALAGNENYSQGGRYRPLSLVVFAILHSLFGMNPFVFHLLNVLLYAGSGFLLYRFATIIFLDLSNRHFISLLIASLFIVHPLHTEVVANVKGMDEILAAGFVFLSLITMLKQVKWIWLSGVFAFLACLSKEHSVMLVLIAPATLYFFNNKFEWKKAMPVIIGCVLYVLIRQMIVGSTEPAQPELLNNPFLVWTGTAWTEMALTDRIGLILQVVGLGFRLLIYPFQLSYDYSPYAVSPSSWFSWQVWFGLLLMLSGIGVIGYSILKKFKPGFGVLWYAAFLIPVSNILFNVGTPFAERFLFLPSAGIVISFVFLLFQIRSKTVSSIFVGATFVLIAAFGLVSQIRSKVWESNVYLLYSESQNRGPENIKWNFDLGVHLLDSALILNDPKIQKDLFERSASHLAKSVTSHPTYYNALLALGASSFYAGNYSGSVEAYRKAYALYPNDLKSKTGLVYALRGLASAQLKNNQLDQASLGLRESYYLMPDTSSIMFAYRTFRDANMPDSARVWLDKSLNFQ